MPQSYKLARTFAPAPDFDDHIAALGLDDAQFCRLIDLPPSTYERARRLGSASMKTARRIACGFALLHGTIAPEAAFSLLFRPRPQVVMEAIPGTRRYRRSAEQGWPDGGEQGAE